MIFSTFSSPIINSNGISIEVLGDPQALSRPMFDTRSQHAYNPSTAVVKEFRDCVGKHISSLDSASVGQLMTAHQNVLLKDMHALKSGDLKSSDLKSAAVPGQHVAVPIPLFPHGDFLVVSLRFMMKRPDSHFKNGNRSMGVRGTLAEGDRSTLKTKDLDNLVKFCLDGLQGPMYGNDSCIVSLQATKELDNEGLCLGRTMICVNKFSMGSMHDPVELDSE